jgi:DNA-binding transcriptional regulator LsrR (DeoR family)
MRTAPKSYAGRYASEWAKEYGISAPTARKLLREADDKGADYHGYIKMKLDDPIRRTAPSDNEVIFNYGLNDFEVANYRVIQALLNSWLPTNKRIE